MRLRLAVGIAVFSLSCACGNNSTSSGTVTSFQAEVIGVHDGDTFTAFVDGNVTLKVRLANIDAPELNQPYGEEAKRELSLLINGKGVEVTEQTTDRYGRMVGIVILDGVDVSSIMVTKGMAWVYTLYNQDGSLPGLESEAREAKRALWADDNPILPWEWRQE